MYMSTLFSMGTIALIIPVSLLVLLHQLRYIKLQFQKAKLSHINWFNGDVYCQPYHFGSFVKDLTHHLELVGSGDCQSSCCSKLPMKGRTHLCCRAQVFDLEVIFRNALRTAYHRQVVGRRCTSDIVKTHGKNS